jgi:hypothetical protein
VLPSGANAMSHGLELTVIVEVTESAEVAMAPSGSSARLTTAAQARLRRRVPSLADPFPRSAVTIEVGVGLIGMKDLREGGR